MSHLLRPRHRKPRIEKMGYFAAHAAGFKTGWFIRRWDCCGYRSDATVYPTRQAAREALWKEKP